MKTAKMPDGKRFCALFNLSMDMLDELPLATDEQISGVMMLQKDGTLAPVAYERTKDGISVKETLYPVNPMILVLDMEG
jgi:hypothetical protein